MQKIFSLTMPYWLAGSLAFTVTIVRRLYTDEPRSYPTQQLDELIEISTEDPMPWALSFPAIAFVFFLWHPQSKVQRLCGWIIGMVFFAIPFMGRVMESHFYLQFLAVAHEIAGFFVCMSISVFLPLTLLMLSKQRLYSASGSVDSLETAFDTPIRRLTIWDILFVTVCIALLSVSLRHPEVGLSPNARQYVHHVIPLAVTSSFAIYLGLSALNLRSTGLNVVRWIGFALLVFLGSLTKQLIQFFETVSSFKVIGLTNFVIVVLVLMAIQGLGLLCFLLLLHGLGFRYGEIRKPPSEP